MHVLTLTPDRPAANVSLRGDDRESAPSGLLLDTVSGLAPVAVRVPVAGDTRRAAEYADADADGTVLTAFATLEFGQSVTIPAGKYTVLRPKRGTGGVSATTGVDLAIDLATTA